jgi:hypothetical protein
MGIESFLSALGLAELAANPAFVAQVVVMAVTALFFFSSLAVAIISFRSAAVAHYAKADAEAHLRTAKSLASEVRSLTAQVEKSASLARAAHGSAGHEAAQMSAHEEHETTASHDGHDEHHISPVLSQKSYAAHGSDDDHQHSHADDHRAHGDHHGGEVEANEKSLDAAKKAATVPFALLRRKRWDS